MKMEAQGFNLGNIAQAVTQRTVATSVLNGAVTPGIIAQAGKSVLAESAAKYANDAISKGINKIFNKYDSNISKVLDYLGLGQGDMSNIYEQISGMPDPLFDWEFQVIMPTISNAWAAAPALPSNYILDIDIPLTNFQVDEFRINASPVKVIGFSDIGDCTVSIYPDHVMQAHNYVNSWYASIKSSNGRYALPYAADNSGYKKMIQVVLFKGNIPVLLFFISGTMPTGRGSYSLKSTPSGSILAYDQTFAVDRVFLTSLYSGQDLQSSSIGESLGKTLVNSISQGVSRSIRGFY